MITGELKNKINTLWEIFWTGGITNPLDVVEQMTYLMFIRDLDDTTVEIGRASTVTDGSGQPAQVVGVPGLPR